MKVSKKSPVYLLGAMAALVGATMPTTVLAHDDHSKITYPISIEMFAPARGDHAGIGGKGWFVDLAIAYNMPLAQSGFTLNGAAQPGFQVTGPGGHNNIPPMPGTFSPGQDERIPSLIVLLSTTTIGAGSCQNLANLFNLTGVTNLAEADTELWDTWIVGAPLFGTDTKSKIYVAAADDINGDGIFNDAPNAVPDANGDGKCDKHDLKAFGLASKVVKTKFYINGDVNLESLPVIP